jgi:NADP-dependent 3-hydroxy acid dehydrogenase YdfG
MPDDEANHLTGRVIVVTGAGGGFGRLISELSAARGAMIVAADVDGDAAVQTVKNIEAAGGQARAVTADVTRKADLDAAVRTAIEAFGAVDVLVNNAGIMPLAFFADHDQAAAAWDRAIDINIKGVVNGIAAVYDRMIEQGRGHIVNISSIYGNGGSAGSGVYSATKAAVSVLSDALRVEAQGKIKVTVVRPTGVPGTNLASGIVNFDAFVGITGQNTDRYGAHVGQWLDGSLPPAAQDIDDVAYWTLSPEDLAGQIVAVIDTPWGFDISDITVRATGEDYVL